MEEQEASKLEPLLVDQAEAEGPSIKDGVTSSDYWREKYYRWTNEVCSVRSLGHSAH